MHPAVNGEVTIICLTDSVHLTDLGLKLTRGARASVPLAAAAKSRDLSTAKIDGTVTTQTMQATVIRARENVGSDTTHSQSPRHNSLDLSPLVAAIQVLTDEVRGLRRDLASKPAAPPPTVDFTPLLARLQAMALVAAPSHAAPVPASAPVPEERFIPSNLTGGDLSASLNVASESSDDPGLADTLKALKAAKKKR
jgi:hypothetical protein